MPVLNFNAQNAPLVESGAKRQTIRRVWKRPIKAGDDLYLKTGMRTKTCRHLGFAVCARVTPVLLLHGSVQVDGTGMPLAAANALAVADGFGGLDPLWAMLDFFKTLYGLPFEGVLIQW